MIVVKLIGGAKKSFLAEILEVDKDVIKIDDLLHHLNDLKPKDTPSLDPANLLVAINGADSSSMQGKETLVKDGDVVSIIPIIHGGQNISFQFNKKTVKVFEIKGSKDADVNFLDFLRKKNPKLKLQAITSKFILNKSHIQKVLHISFNSEKIQTLLANKIETDILMRFANTTQIVDAIKLAGMKKNQNFFLICIGSKNLIDKLENEIKEKKIPPFQKDNSPFLKKHFRVTKRNLETVLSDSPLEDILVEKAAVLL